MKIISDHNIEQSRARRKELLDLINKILRGEIDSSQFPLDELFQSYTSIRDQYQLGGPRRQYISPEDRSTYNYQYMEIDEMTAGDPNIW